MPSDNNDERNGEKQGYPESTRSFAARNEDERRKISNEEKKAAHELDSDDGHEARCQQSSYESGQHKVGAGQGSHRDRTNSGSGSTRGSSFEYYTEVDERGGQSSDSGAAQFSSGGDRGNQQHKTNSKSGSTRGGSSEQFVDAAKQN